MDRTGNTMHISEIPLEMLLKLLLPIDFLYLIGNIY